MTWHSDKNIEGIGAAVLAIPEERAFTLLGVQWRLCWAGRLPKGNFAKSNRLLKKDFEPARWRKVFRFRRKTARNSRSMCRFWTDFPVYRNWSRRFSTFSAAC